MSSPKKINKVDIDRLIKIKELKERKKERKERECY